MASSLSRLAFILILAALSIPQAPLHADTFGTGANTFNIQFVTIGDPGNLADTTGDPNPAGSVAYEYRIGKYEISEQMIDKANAQSALDGNPLNITKDTRGPDKPATRVSWFEVAQFVNWLNLDVGSSPAYKFDINGNFQLWSPGDAGYNPANAFRNTQAQYFLPSADEWYKAAFYDPVTDTWFDFPNGSDTAPVPVASGNAPNTAVISQPFGQGPADIMLAGGMSPNGTVAQAGNVFEWDETVVDLVNDDPMAARGFRGGDWNSSVDSLSLTSSFRHFVQAPSNSVAVIGFRIASLPIPEPNSLYLLAFASGACLYQRQHRHKKQTISLLKKN